MKFMGEQWYWVLHKEEQQQQQQHTTIIQIHPSQFLSFHKVNPTLIVQYCVPPPCALRNSCACLAVKSLSSSNMTPYTHSYLPHSCLISLFSSFSLQNIRLPLVYLTYMPSFNPRLRPTPTLFSFRLALQVSSFDGPPLSHKFCFFGRL